MINVFEALKSEGLVIQDPNDPTGSTWIMSQDADKVVEKVEKLVDYAWKTGRAYQIFDLLMNKLPRRKEYPKNASAHQEVGVGAYNQAIDEVREIIEKENEKIYETSSL